MPKTHIGTPLNLSTCTLNHMLCSDYPCMCTGYMYSCICEFDDTLDPQLSEHLNLSKYQGDSLTSWYFYFHFMTVRTII